MAFLDFLGSFAANAGPGIVGQRNQALLQGVQIQEGRADRDLKHRGLDIEQGRIAAIQDSEDRNRSIQYANEIALKLTDQAFRSAADRNGTLGKWQQAELRHRLFGSKVADRSILDPATPLDPKYDAFLGRSPANQSGGSVAGALGGNVDSEAASRPEMGGPSLGSFNPNQPMPAAGGPAVPPPPAAPPMTPEQLATLQTGFSAVAPFLPQGPAMTQALAQYAQVPRVGPVPFATLAQEVLGDHPGTGFIPRRSAATIQKQAQGGGGGTVDPGTGGPDPGAGTQDPAARPTGIGQGAQQTAARGPATVEELLAADPVYTTAWNNYLRAENNPESTEADRQFWFQQADAARVNATKIAEVWKKYGYLDRAILAEIGVNEAQATSALALADLYKEQTETERFTRPLTADKLIAEAERYRAAGQADLANSFLKAAQLNEDIRHNRATEGLTEYANRTDRAHKNALIAQALAEVQKKQDQLPDAVKQLGEFYLKASRRTVRGNGGVETEVWDQGAFDSARQLYLPYGIDISRLAPTRDPKTGAITRPGAGNAGGPLGLSFRPQGAQFMQDWMTTPEGLQGLETVRGLISGNEFEKNLRGLTPEQFNQNMDRYRVITGRWHRLDTRNPARSQGGKKKRTIGRK